MIQENNQNNFWAENAQNDWVQQEPQQTDMQENFTQENFTQENTEYASNSFISNNIDEDTNKLPFEKLPNILSEEDRKLLNSIASTQIDYGHANEAIALLLLCRLNAPDDLQTLRLLIRAYLHNEWWDRAEQINEEFRYYSQQNNSFFHLFSALSLLGKKKLDEARNHFKIFSQSKLRISS